MKNYCNFQKFVVGLELRVCRKGTWLTRDGRGLGIVGRGLVVGCGGKVVAMGVRVAWQCWVMMRLGLGFVG